MRRLKRKQPNNLKKTTKALNKAFLKIKAEKEDIERKMKEDGLLPSTTPTPPADLEMIATQMEQGDLTEQEIENRYVARLDVEAQEEKEPAARSKLEEMMDELDQELNETIQEMDSKGSEPSSRASTPDPVPLVGLSIFSTTPPLPPPSVPRNPVPEPQNLPPQRPSAPSLQLDEFDRDIDLELGELGEIGTLNAGVGAAAVGGVPGRARGFAPALTTQWKKIVLVVGTSFVSVWYALRNASAKIDLEIIKKKYQIGEGSLLIQRQLEQKFSNETMLPVIPQLQPLPALGPPVQPLLPPQPTNFIGPELPMSALPPPELLRYPQSQSDPNFRPASRPSRVATGILAGGLFLGIFLIKGRQPDRKKRGRHVS